MSFLRIVSRDKWGIEGRRESIVYKIDKLCGSYILGRAYSCRSGMNIYTFYILIAEHMASEKLWAEVEVIRARFT